MPDYPVGPPRRDYVDGYPGDTVAVPDPPPYPADWDSEQRISAYWYAHGYSIAVRSTEAWNAVLADAQRTADRHQAKVHQERP